MNLARHDKAIARLVDNEYRFAGFIAVLLDFGAIPECHRVQARRLLADHEGANRERTASLDEQAAA